MLIYAPVSIGEMLDKITILEIKNQRIKDPQMLRNVKSELEILNKIIRDAGVLNKTLEPMIDELRAVNEKLWDIEDGKRECEKAGVFLEKFISLARSAYQTNDKRASIKKRINHALGSDLVEEKLYKG